MLTVGERTRCEAHIERVKAKVEMVNREPQDAATSDLVDAIVSIVIVLETLARAEERVGGKS